MNLAYLQYVLPEFDEIRVIGQDVEKEGWQYHIVGMTRLKKKAKLYVLGIEAPWEEENFRRKGKDKETVRNARKKHFYEHRNYFMSLCEWKSGDIKLKVESASAGRLEMGDSTKEILLLAEFMKAGWKITEDNKLFEREWKEVSLAEISFATEIEVLPEWNREMLQVRLRRDNESQLIEKSLILYVGREKELTFALKDGRHCICYINKIFPIDVWKEQEESFNDASYLEHMKAEELEKLKGDFYEALEQSCPKGMCYLEIEYECTEDVVLEFYSKEYLNQVPKIQRGSASSIMMMSKPEKPVGKHGLKQRVCIIQTPITSEVKEMKAELFAYQVTLSDKQERL